MIKNISNLGDAAVYCDFGPEVNEATNNDDDNADKKKRSLEELADITRLLASWSSKYSPSNISWEEADKQHLTMAEVLKGAVRSIPGKNV